MRSLFHWLERLIQRYWQSIAGLPSLMVLGFTVFAALMLWLDENILYTWHDTDDAIVRIFLIDGPDTARTLLGAIIGGLFSLTVFSFSMVMIVLNSASSSLTPRLQPAIIKARSNQLVLGMYLGVLAFCFIILIGIAPAKETVYVPAFSVFMAVSLGLLCLGFFVYFIASISKHIQVGRVIDRVEDEVLADIREEHGKKDNYGQTELPIDLDQWTPIYAKNSGYIDDLLFSRLVRLADELDGPVYLTVPRGTYVLKGEILLRLQSVPKDRQPAEVAKNIQLIDKEFENWYFHGIRHLTQVGMKAMSPGINDYGTAIIVIQKLSAILSEWMNMPLYNYRETKGGHRLYFAPIDRVQSLREIMESFRTYSRQDIRVMRALLRMLRYLLSRCADTDRKMRGALRTEIDQVLTDAKAHIGNSRDLESLH